MEMAKTHAEVERIPAVRPTPLTFLARYPRATAFSALVMLLMAAYANVIFGGASLVFSNNENFLDPRPMEQNYGPGFTPAAVWNDRNLLPTANFHDAGGPMWQWEPAGEFLRQALADGELPFWNPYRGGGTPEMANLIPGDFFPPYLLLVLLGNTVALKNAYFLLEILAAGLFTLLLLRRHGLHAAAAAGGAVAFMFCGAVSQNIGSFQGQAICGIPFAVYVARLFTENPGPRGAALLAIGWAFLALASFPPVLVGAFGFAAAYAVAMILFGDDEPAPGARPRALTWLAVGTALGIGLAAFAYFPAFAALRAAPQVARAYRHAADASSRPASVFQFASPVLMGGGEVFRSSPMPEPEGIHQPYVGVLPLLLCVMAVMPSDRTRRVFLAVIVVVGGVALAKTFGVPPVQWLSKLPVLRNIHFGNYLGSLLGFLFALGSACGLQTVLEGKSSPWRALVAGMGGALALGILWDFAAHHGVLTHPAGALWVREWRVAAVFIFLGSVALIVGGVAGARSAVRMGAVVFLLALLAVEMLHLTRYPRQQRWDVWRSPPPYVQRLLANPGYGRVFSAGLFTADAGSAFRIFQLDSMMAANPERIFELYRRYVAPYAFTFLREAERIPPEGVLDRANIEYLVLRKEMPKLASQLAQRSYETVYDDGFAQVFHRRGSPRYFFTSHYRVMDAPAALDALGSLDPGREIILEESRSIPSSPNSPADPAVEVVRFRRNGYTLRLDAPRGGHVYCSESFAEGWSAQVNGRPATILPANYAFRAVEVPRGPVTITFSYWPPWLTAGLLVTSLSWVVIAGILWWSRSLK